MPGEKYFFRKKFFGGFNREDVVAYIAQIAKERNTAIADKEKANEEIQKLHEALSEKQEIIKAYEKLIEKLRHRATPANTPPADLSPSPHETTPEPQQEQMQPEPIPAVLEKPNKSVIIINRKINNGKEK